jgi:excisionase family DNA binding protein|tara:strand:- start:276 stop:500 length:225 start_codon:yes stop_codon:yes gene_type:complete
MSNKRNVMAQIKEKILLTEDEVSKLFNINKHTLQRERFNGTGIPYVKLGRRVRYKVEDIQKYIERNTIGNHRYD